MSIERTGRRYKESFDHCSQRISWNRMGVRLGVALFTLVALAGRSVAVGVAEPDSPPEDPAGGSAATSPSGPEATGSTQPPVPILESLLTPLPRGLAVREFVVGSDGGTADVSGGATRLVYSNTLGTAVFSPPTAGVRFADDITTTAVHGCGLDRYSIRVSGDARGDGSGVGPYGVDVALYATCPGATTGLMPIAGTAAHADLPDNGMYDVVVAVPPDMVVPLPSSLYLGVSFSRPYAGIVVGAPALLGFSADRIDYPGFPCAAGFGGFPDASHASVYVEVYVREDCAESFAAYNNSNDAGNAYSAGARVYFADDIRLNVQSCRLIAYEVSHKGDGFFSAQLNTFLSNSSPGQGGMIPGTRIDCFSIGSNPQICRKEFNPPILFPGPNLLVVFRSGASAIGPIRTCQYADPGRTENFYMIHTDGRWGVSTFPGICHAGFDVTIYCEGHPPLGACCDMIFTDEQGESVCRNDLPEMNCPFPELWKEGRICDSVCAGGANNGLPCTRQADCPGGKCPGPFAKPCGQAACCKPDGRCANLTENQCNAVPPVEDARVYQKGRFCAEGDQFCPFPSCMNGHVDCCNPDLPVAICVGGPDDGQPCRIFTDPPGDCHGFCVGGSNAGNECFYSQTCPDGTCNRQPHCISQGAGCNDPLCCAMVCEYTDPWDPWGYYASCCTWEWDWHCAWLAQQICDCGGPSNDDCYDPSPIKGARLIQNIPSEVDSDGIGATDGVADPGFCCHADSPGAKGTKTLWFKFIAPPNGLCAGGTRNGQFCDPNAADPNNTTNGCPGGVCNALPTSVYMDTCCSYARLDHPADDSIMQIFTMADPDRGVCSDGLTQCSVEAQNCPEGESCVLDEDWGCQHLVPIACSDDAGTSCACGPVQKPNNSKLCVQGLNPGQMYYVMIGAKTAEHDGVWTLRIASPCTPDQPPLHNDLCINAEVLAGGHVEVAFDLSGALFGEAPATFDCPGPPSFCTTMQEDVWYDWIASCGGYATFQTCDVDNPPTPNTRMVVYDGCECPVVSGTELICNNDNWLPTPCFLGSRGTTLVEEGHCYKVRVGRGGFDGEAQGTLHLDVDCFEGCPSGEIRFERNGLVDARRPHPRDDSGHLEGLAEIRVSGPPGSENPECWSLAESASLGPPNWIEWVRRTGSSGPPERIDATLKLGRPVTPGAVTRITYADDNGQETDGCFTSHPGNVNADGRTAPSDILFLIDVLNRVRTAPWGMYSTDCDHSGATGPADILCVIDLLNGAGAFDPWLNTPMPPMEGCRP